MQTRRQLGSQAHQRRHSESHGWVAGSLIPQEGLLPIRPMPLLCLPCLLDHPPPANPVGHHSACSQPTPESVAALQPHTHTLPIQPPTHL